MTPSAVLVEVAVTIKKRHAQYAMAQDIVIMTPMNNIEILWVNKSKGYIEVNPKV